MTKREQIIDAIMALLAGVTGVSGRVYRSRTELFERDEAPAISVTWERETPRQNVIDFVDKDLSVDIMVYTRGDEPDSLADPICEQIHSLLLNASTLGGLSLDITESGTDIEMDDADTPACFTNMRYTVWYRHARNSLAG